MNNERPTVRAPIPSNGVLDDETQRALGVDPDDARQASLVKALAKQIGACTELPRTMTHVGRMSGKTAALKEAERMIDEALAEPEISETPITTYGSRNWREE
jgi:hypothetical protein